MPPQEQAAPRRQVRGLRRIEAILDAAEAVLGSSGYESATTNQIAAEAGISPGSLYQYFSSKSEIVAALAKRLLFVYESAYVLDDDQGPGEQTVPGLVDSLIDPLVAFNLAHPATRYLMAGADLSPELAEATSELHARLRQQVETLVRGVSPAGNGRDWSLAATVSMHIASACLPAILEASPRRRKLLVAELKFALRGYWSTLSTP